MREGPSVEWRGERERESGESEREREREVVVEQAVYC